MKGQTQSREPFEQGTYSEIELGPFHHRLTHRSRHESTDAEITEFETERTLINQNVRRFDITMKNILRFQKPKGVGDLLPISIVVSES